jgi:3-keto-5-aminohexanoate cleavage enzyme
MIEGGIGEVELYNYSKPHFMRRVKMKSDEKIQLKSQGFQPIRFQDEPIFSSPKKLIILSAAPGSMIAKEQNPYLPTTPKEIVENHVGAYKAGAAMVHVHVRDENGLPTGNPELYKRVILDLKDKCPDIIIDSCFAHPFDIDSVDARLEPLCKLNLPIETGVISGGTLNIIGQNVYVNREEYLIKAAKYLQECNIRPVITLYNIKLIVDMKRWAIDSGLVKKPFLNLSLGLFGEPAQRDILQLWLKYIPETCDIIVETAGRNWLPVTVEAILSQRGHVRAGMEDGIYMYGHKNDLMKSSAEVVTKVRTIAEELGREIATPKEAREILGLQGKV